jgi:hypothetical protein
MWGIRNSKRMLRGGILIRFGVCRSAWNGDFNRLNPYEKKSIINEAGH